MTDRRKVDEIEEEIGLTEVKLSLLKRELVFAKRAETPGDPLALIRKKIADEKADLMSRIAILEEELNGELKQEGK